MKYIFQQYQYYYNKEYIVNTFKNRDNTDGGNEGKFE